MYLLKVWIYYKKLSQNVSTILAVKHPPSKTDRKKFVSSFVNVI